LPCESQITALSKPRSTAQETAREPFGYRQDALASVGAMSGAAAGPFIHGLLHDITGSDIPGFLLGILASLISIAAIWIAAPRHVRRVGRPD
jgi:hypothetical protein